MQRSSQSDHALLPFKQALKSTMVNCKSVDLVSGLFFQFLCFILIGHPVPHTGHLLSLCPFPPQENQKISATSGSHPKTNKKTCCAFLWVDCWPRDDAAIHAVLHVDLRSCVDMGLDIAPSFAIHVGGRHTDTISVLQRVSCQSNRKCADTTCF